MEEYLSIAIDLARTGDDGPIEKFLQHVSDEDDDRYKVLRGATDRGYDELLKALSAFGQVDIINNDDGMTALHIASGYFDAEAVVKKLLFEGSDMDAKGEDGRTPLHLAACFCHIAPVKQLLAAKADSRIKDEDGAEALHLAAKGGDVEIVSVLLKEANIYVNAADLKGLTPLHYAAKYGNVEVLQVLLEANASCKIQEVLDCVVFDPIFGGSGRAEGSARAEIIKALANAGADVMRRDSDGGTFLHRVISALSLWGTELDDAINALVACGVELDGRDRYRRTALHFAIGRRRWDVVKLLFELGGSLAVPDNNGITPLELLRPKADWNGEAKEILDAVYRRASGFPDKLAK